MDTISVPTEENEHSGSDLDNAPVTLVSNNQLQQSVIQSAHLIQVGSDGDASAAINANPDGDDSKKRRDLLNRRPSYRKIFNELSDTPNAITVAKIEEESDSGDSDLDESQANHSSGNNTNTSANLQYSQGQVPGAIQIAAHGDGSAQGLQTLTMSNITSTPNSQVNNSGATIVQYAQGPDGQFFIPVSTISAGSISYQIAPGSTLGQGVTMVTGGNNVGGSPQTVGEEASRKRELRLLKNREAARECRRKKKEYIKCLENRVALLENQNKTLIEELKSLKELYCQKDIVPS